MQVLRYCDLPLLLLVFWGGRCLVDGSSQGDGVLGQSLHCPGHMDGDVGGHTLEFPHTALDGRDRFTQAPAHLANGALMRDLGWHNDAAQVHCLQSDSVLQEDGGDEPLQLLNQLLSSQTVLGSCLGDLGDCLLPGDVADKVLQYADDAALRVNVSGLGVEVSATVDQVEDVVVVKAVLAAVAVKARGDLVDGKDWLDGKSPSVPGLYSLNVALANLGAQVDDAGNHLVSRGKGYPRALYAGKAPAAFKDDGGAVVDDDHARCPKASKELGDWAGRLDSLGQGAVWGNELGLFLPQEYRGDPVAQPLSHGAGLLVLGKKNGDGGVQQERARQYPAQQPRPVPPQWIRADAGAFEDDPADEQQEEE